MPKILLTGSAGFVGYHLFKRLQRHPDMEVLGVDSLNNYYDVNLKLGRLKDCGFDLENIAYGRTVESASGGRFGKRSGGPGCLWKTRPTKGGTNDGKTVRLGGLQRRLPERKLRLRLHRLRRLRVRLPGGSHRPQRKRRGGGGRNQVPGLRRLRGRLSPGDHPPSRGGQPHGG